MKYILKINKSLKFDRSAFTFITILVFAILMIRYDAISLSDSKSPETSLASFSPQGPIKGSVVAASCGFGDSSGHYLGDTVCGGTCPAGSTPLDGVCVANCTNGAINPNICDQCPSGKTLVSGQCVDTCANGSAPTFSCGNGYTLSGNNCLSELICAQDYYPLVSYIRPNGMCAIEIIPGGWLNVGEPSRTTIQASLSCDNVCNNGATNSPECTTCPAGKTMIGGQCVNSCTNGAINYPTCTTCPSGQSMVNGSCVANCVNGAINAPNCNVCNTPSTYWNGTSCVPNPCGNVLPPINYDQPCGGGRNSCGQPISSGRIQCDGSCTTSTNPNTSCIQTFYPNTNSVYPNGSVDFSWKVLPPVDGGSVKCGFYDRSKGNGVGLGVPIPGLQDLDISVDKLRINNIQRNTEFCLVCAYSDKSGNPQTPAALHQWVRVIRLGEN